MIGRGVKSLFNSTSINRWLHSFTLCSWINNQEFFSESFITGTVHGHNLSPHPLSSSVPPPTFFVQHINNLLSPTYNGNYSYAYDYALSSNIQYRTWPQIVQLDLIHFSSLQPILFWGTRHLETFNGSST